MCRSFSLISNLVFFVDSSYKLDPMKPIQASIFFLLLSLSSCATSSPFQSIDTTKPTSIQSAEIIRHSLMHPEESDREKFAVRETSPYQIPMQSFSVHPAHDGEIKALIVLQGGTSVLSGGRDGKLILSRITSPFIENNQGFMETELIYESSKSILALAISPEERFLAIAQSGEVRILDLRKRKVVSLLSHVSGRVTALAWDPRNEFILLGLANGEIYAWNFFGEPEKASNSISSLEFYFASDTPIIKMLIHPKARSFFSLEQNGVLNFWRLQRAELEEGSRDLDADIDQDRRSQQRTEVARLPDQLYDMWYSDKGFVYLVGASGVIYSYKIRGLKALDPVTVSRSEVFSIQGYGSSNILALSNREQRIDFWCKAYRGEPERLFESKIFPYTISHLASIPGSMYLWAATKTGKLLSLELNRLFAEEKLKSRTELCVD